MNEPSTVATGVSPVKIEWITRTGTAYAEVGRFPEAIETTERGIMLATSQNHTDVAGLLQGDLKLLQSGQPLRDAGKSAITR
jgi:hypothetical protein